jgi:hypothetical protein
MRTQLLLPPFARLRTRLVLVLVLTLGAVAAGSPSGLAAASVQRSTTAFTAQEFFTGGVGGSIFNPCTGESLTFEGEVILKEMVITTPRTSQITIHEVARGVAATGGAGTHYVVPFTSMAHFHYLEGQQRVFTARQAFQIVSRGPSSNFIVFATIHYTFDSAGQVIAQVNKVTAGCRR